jgi:energy-converting hydrogenase Eha subunit G
MDSRGQFSVFLLCILTGFCGGIIYEVFAFIRLLFRCDKGKGKSLGVVLDGLFGLAFAVWGIFTAYFFRFPQFRWFMCLGWALGGIIYLKTLRRIVAFLEKVCYNVVVKVLQKAKTRKKLFKKERDLT